MSSKPWPAVKGRIIAVTRSGELREMATRLDCTVEALRQAVQGKCPRVAAKLKRAIGYDWEGGRR